MMKEFKMDRLMTNHWKPSIMRMFEKVFVEAGLEPSQYCYDLIRILKLIFHVYGFPFYVTGQKSITFFMSEDQVKRIRIYAYTKDTTIIVYYHLRSFTYEILFTKINKGTNFLVSKLNGEVTYNYIFNALKSGKINGRRSE